MNLFVRWCRFNLVGVMGMAVQLATLTLLMRCMHGHYLAASAAAIEVTLAHNFVWHLRYTWRERRNAPGWPGQLIRFQLSNGLVSMFGNLCLMGVLVRHGHLPVLIANGIAIPICSIVNFQLGHHWAFAADRPSHHWDCRPGISPEPQYPNCNPTGEEKENLAWPAKARHPCLWDENTRKKSRLAVRITR